MVVWLGGVAWLLVLMLLTPQNESLIKWERYVIVFILSSLFDNTTISLCSFHLQWIHWFCCCIVGSGSRIRRWWWRRTLHRTYDESIEERRGIWRRRRERGVWCWCWRRIQTAAGISGGSPDAKTGSKRGGKISDGGSPATRSRKRLYQALTGGRGGREKEKIGTQFCFSGSLLLLVSWDRVAIDWVG